MPNYPPLTPLDDLPLHGDALEAHEAWACEVGWQGGPQNFDTRYDWRCDACVKEAEQELLDVGDIDHEWFLDGRDANGGRKWVKLSWLVSRSRYWLHMDDTSKHV
jgi:hypothetical protein